ncbi:MAG: GntR family transcriptional regulator [Bauldia sp.]|nr:GntR family transcriptional regulator [Bauldia sp.]
MLNDALGTGDGTRSAADQTHRIQEAIYDAIVEQRLPPGTKLSEAEVGAAFAVSRTITRRALQALAHAGIVTIERNRGAFVARPDPEEARQVFAARRLVEPDLTRSAARSCTRADLARLKKHLDAEAAALKRDDRRTAIRLSGDFHLRIADISGNAVLARFLRDLTARTSLIVAIYGRSRASACGVDEHRELYEMLARRDEKGAPLAMLHHLDHIEADLDLGDAPDGAVDLAAILRGAAAPRD